MSQTVVSVTSSHPGIRYPTVVASALPAVAGVAIPRKLADDQATLRVEQGRAGGSPFRSSNLPVLHSPVGLCHVTILPSFYGRRMTLDTDFFDVACRVMDAHATVRRDGSIPTIHVDIVRDRRRFG